MDVDQFKQRVLYAVLKHFRRQDDATNEELEEVARKAAHGMHGQALEVVIEQPPLEPIKFEVNAENVNITVSKSQGTSNRGRRGAYTQFEVNFLAMHYEHGQIEL